MSDYFYSLHYLLFAALWDNFCSASVIAKLQRDIANEENQ